MSQQPYSLLGVQGVQSVQGVQGIQGVQGVQGVQPLMSYGIIPTNYHPQQQVFTIFAATEY